jgi:hypothetical protein
VTIILLAGSIPLTLKMMARASAAYERKAQERARAAEGSAPSDAEAQPLDQGDERN